MSEILSKPRSVGLVVALLFALGLMACVGDDTGPLPVDATTGKCPVCKMKVKAEDAWASEIIYADGTKLMFETPGDMLTFYSDPARFDVAAAQKDLSKVEKILVKEYKTKAHIDARNAVLVYKSKINGPMGPDVIAFNASSEAEAFVAENGGTVLALNQLTPEMVKNLRKK
ncbi:MAG TPA: nitrous oxide reductase accessory protein NosL [Blastocatellia bacterium]|nr:nitrous oxide reductase accessory protein NosL [Blastocatellia bacterium]